MRKLLLVTMAVLCFCGAAFGQYVKVLGIAEKSGSAVVSGISSTNKPAITFPLSTIDIYNAGTVVHATIYSNSTGTIKANPFTATAEAYYDFFIASGAQFDVRVSGISNGVTITPFTRSGYTAPGTSGITQLLCGGTNDTTLLATASALGGTLQIPNGITCASNTQTLSAALQVDNGGLLKPLTGQTLTLTGPQLDGTWQRFTNATSGLGTIAFTGNTKLRMIQAAWWGTPVTQAEVTAARAATVTASSGSLQLPDQVVLDAGASFIPLAAPGSVTLADAGAGTLSAGTYKIGVVAVNDLGGEGQFDPLGYAENNSIIIGASHNISATWQAVPGASSYRVYVWGPSGAYYQRYYSTISTSLTISTQPVGPVAVPLTVTPSNTGGSLRRGNYYFNVEAEFSDGGTVDQTNYNEYPVGSVTADTGSVALSWTALTGAVQYRVYVVSEQDGNPRVHTKYFVTPSNSVTVTGTETYVRGVAASQAYGDREAESSAVGIFGSIRTTSNSKSFFGADIQIAANKNSDALFQSNRFGTAGYGGMDIREDGQIIWNVGMPNNGQYFTIRHTSNADYLTILPSNGNVRLGVTGGDPQDKLVVVGGAVPNYGIELGNAVSGGSSRNQITSFDRDAVAYRDLRLITDSGEVTLVLKGVTGFVGVQNNSPATPLDVIGATTSTSLLLRNTGKLSIAPKTNDTYSASVTIDNSITNHVIAASFTTSSTSTFAPSNAGSAGDTLIITTEADASGTVTVTFGGFLHSSGTQATTASHFSTIVFQSDGTRWLEIARTTNLA